MTVESVTYISDLNDTYPVGTDAKSEGDDHIRNIKTGLSGTFPSFAGAAMTATEAELNNLDGYTGNTSDLNILSGAAAAGLTAAELQHVKSVTSDIQTQIDSKGSGDLLAANNLSEVTPATARTNLGLGSLATLNSVAAGQIDSNSVNHSEISFDSTTGTFSVGVGATVIPEGLHWLYHATSGADLEVSVNVTGSFIGVKTIGTPTLIYSDGTNMRITNNSGSSKTVSYRRLS